MSHSEDLEFQKEGGKGRGTLPFMKYKHKNNASQGTKAEGREVEGMEEQSASRQKGSDATHLEQQ